MYISGEPCKTCRLSLFSFCCFDSGGSALDKDGRGDKGNACGIMQASNSPFIYTQVSSSFHWHNILLQIDQRHHKVGNSGTKENIMQAAKIVSGYRDQVAKKHPGWTDEQK